MRILILTNNDVGLYQFRKELIKELIKENIVMISLPNGELIEQLQDMGCCFIDTPVDRRGINPVKDIKLLIQYLGMIKRQRPDLVITYTIKPNVYGGFACRLKKISYVVNITGLGTAFQESRVLRKLVTLMYRVGLKKAKTVFFENVENRQVFLEERIVRKGQCCLLNGAGVNLEHYHLAKYPEDDEITRFLFIGRVMKEKGINELLDAMQLMIQDGINCFLDVVGGCEENYFEILKKYEKDGWLQYHGYQKDVRIFIQKCHCFVLPSWHEGMANTNLECAAMGRPVITSNIFGCKEAVIDNISGYLTKRKDSKNLYFVMKKFVDLSYDEKKNMGYAGRIHMIKNFNKKKVVHNTLTKLF